MAGETKRTSRMLVVLFVIFVAIAIILCFATLVPGSTQGHYNYYGEGSGREGNRPGVDEVLNHTSTTAPTPTTVAQKTTSVTTPTKSTEGATPPPPLTQPPPTSDTTSTTTSQLPTTTTTTTSPETSSVTIPTEPTEGEGPPPPTTATTTTEGSTTTIPPSSPQATTTATDTTTSEPLPPPSTSESPESTSTSESPESTSTSESPESTSTSESSAPTTIPTTSQEASEATTPTTTSPPPTTTPALYSDLTPTTTSDATQSDATSSPATSDTTLDSSTTLESASSPTQSQSTHEPTSTTSEPSTSTTESLEETESTTSIPTESSTDSSYSTVSSTTTTTSTLTSTTPSHTALCPTADAPEPEDVCMTPACKTVAARMLNMMDHTQEQPCKDFYQYACGGVMDDLFLDPESRQEVTNRAILDSIKDVLPTDPLLGPIDVFYDSCTNAERDSSNKTAWLSDARTAFNTLGWSEAANFTTMLAEMLKIHFAPFFDVLLDVAEDGTDKFVLMLTPPVLPSPLSKDVAWAICYEQHLSQTKEASGSYDVKLEYAKYSECIGKGAGLQARLHQMRRAVEELGLIRHFNYITHSGGVKGLLDDNLRTTENLLGDLHDMFPSKPDLRENHLKRNFNSVTLSYLEQKFNFVNFKVEWQTLVEDLLGPHVDPDSVAVHIYFEDQLHDIFEKLDIEQPDQLQRILLLLLAERFYTDLVEPTEHDLGKPEYCLRVTTKLLGDFVSFLYLDNLPHLQERQQKMEDMIKANMAAAKAELMNGSSVAQDAKEMWLNKLSGMKGQVPNPEDLSLYLEQSMNETSLSENFVENCLTLLRRYRTLMYQQYQASPSRPQVLWTHFHKPFSTSGVSLYASNTFLIPYAAMEAPLFLKDVPDYINYAGIGHMIAHEVMHGFDSTGIIYNGTRREILKDYQHFQKVSECLAEQYRAHQSQTTASGLKANFRLGTLPLNEVLADSGAVRLAWDAYEHSNSSGVHAIHGQRLPWLNLKPQQLYFLRIAQTHCSATSNIHMLSLMEDEHLPPRLRVNLMLGNEPRFTEAFNCPAAPHQCPYILG